VVVLLAGFLAFLFTRSNGPRAFALSFSEGRTTSFRTTLTMNVRLVAPEMGLDQPVTATMVSTMSMKVLSVDASGTATIELTTKDAAMTVEGYGTQDMDDSTITLHITKDGRVVETPGHSSLSVGGGGLSIPGMDQFTPLLPDHPVSVGDEWTKDFSVPNPFGSGQLRTSSKNKLLRYESFQGVRAAVLHTIETVPMDGLTFDLGRMAGLLGEDLSDLPPGTNPTLALDGSMTMDQTSRFDVSGGAMLSMEASGTFDLGFDLSAFPDASGTFRETGTMTMTMELLPG
jgi:hypothetical protein